MGQTKRIHAKDYAKNLYGEHKQYVHIATEAFRAGEDNAVFVMRKESELYKELEELRQYKKENEEMINDPNRLADMIAGL